MHVVFISSCKKKAFKRTRTLLDSYAKRTGDRSWLTPITQEGLAELHKTLRKSATRQTSVACFKNDGRKRMYLLWTVGNKKNFDKNGASPIATTQKTRASNFPKWAKTCALIAQTSGFMHDLGKLNQEFQDKLKYKGVLQNNARQDSVRHEWISMFLAHYLIEGESWQDAVEKTIKSPRKFWEHEYNTLVFEKQLCCAADALLYCIATHHKLPQKDVDCISNKHHVNLQKEKFKNPEINFSPSQKLLSMIINNLKKIRECDIDINDHTYWRAIATFSRMALILADQSISAESHQPTTTSNDTNNKIAFANTHGKDRHLNQELCWHLENVGLKAGKMVFHLLNIDLPNLSESAIEKITQTSEKRYAWQNSASFAITASCKKHDIPHLLLNIASTGSGKTRMNLKAICALNEDKPIRIATALNLRTLTLQTADAYHEQVGIEKNEMACVIGDSLTQKLHESSKLNVDEDEVEESIDVVSDFEFDMPPWLKFYSEKNPKLNDIIGAPLLISTIDFLISAGEPNRKHHHILAATRIMHSDLILDEIDGYEPKALLSVLRLVTVSALFGKNVIASSATLSKEVAKKLWEAYEHGAKMRGLLNKIPALFNTTIIDDLIKPTIGTYTKVNDFISFYESHIQTMINALKKKPYRVPMLANIKEYNVEKWHDVIVQQAKILHRSHAWEDDLTGKKISFGLVRIANITTAVETAKHLSKKIPNSKIVCYHSNHFPMQRFHIEKRLDFLLTRKGEKPNKHILLDPEIRKILTETTDNSIYFIVVATPVEEIGRDHDFDWAIIEPSSSQSIVQTSGRVNRHRLDLISKPNVAILQYCHREICGKKLVFVKPGLEITISDNTIEESTHKLHDIKQLFDWSHMQQIDARMRFSSEIHLFAKFDDEAIENGTRDIFESMQTKDNLWMAKETYTESSLRSSEPTVKLCLINPEYPDKYQVSSTDYRDGKENKNNTHLELSENNPNEWLIKTDLDLIEEAKELQIFNESIMTVSIPYYGKKNKEPFDFVEKKICRHKSFGFYIKRSVEKAIRNS